MKKLYLSRLFLAVLCFFGFVSGNLFAQTMPAPQKLPHSQNFNTLLVTDTSYPAGYQGWTAGTSNPPGDSQFATSGTFCADRALVANSSASTNSGNFHNYNGKIGFLTTGSLDLTIGFAFDATGQSPIPVEYDAMTIRNPYGDGTNN